MSKINAVTPATLSARYPKGCMPPKEIEYLYEVREEFVQRLGQKTVINVNDLRDLDRGGRCMVAESYFKKCDNPAQHALLTDPHHFVRSVAFLSQ